MKLCFMKSLEKLEVFAKKKKCSRLVCQASNTFIEQNLSVTEKIMVFASSVVDGFHCILIFRYVFILVFSVLHFYVGCYDRDSI